MLNQVKALQLPIYAIMHFHLPLKLSRKRNLINIHLFEEDWRAAIAELECHPLDAQTWTTRTGFFDGNHEARVLPIHIACSLHAPLEVVRAIVEAYPGCLSAKESSFKRLPIHVACMSAAPLDVIEYLAQEYAAATLEPDTLGRLSIHYACNNGAPMDVVGALLRVNSASALYADRNGWLPLHVATRSGASTEVIRQIVRACPAAVTIKTQRSSTALSLAEKVQAKNQKEVIKILKCSMVVEVNDSKKFSNSRKVSMAA